MNRKLIRFLDIALTIFTILLYVAVAVVSVALWWTGMEFVTKLVCTIYGALVCSFGLYLCLIIISGRSKWR